MILARVGEQTGHAAYACINRIPLAASGVDIWRLIKRGTITPQIGPSQVVREDENKIEPLIWGSPQFKWKKFPKENER